MSVFDKFKKGAVKAGIQASVLFKEGSSRVQSSSQSFAQGFSLPGEAEKAAKILETFLGLCSPPSPRTGSCSIVSQADPDRPESALNSIPKAVLQRARGCLHSHILRPSPTDSTYFYFPFSKRRPRRLPGPQGGLCFLWQSGLWPRHSTLTRWLVVCPVLYRDGRCRLGSPDRRGYHRLCHRPQQRRRGSGILSRWKPHHWWERQCDCWSYRHWRERSSEPCTSRTDVLVLQI